MKVHLFEHCRVFELFRDDLNEVSVEESLDCENWGVSFLLFVANAGNRNADISLFPSVTVLECGLPREVFSIKPPSFRVSIIVGKLLGIP